MSSGGQSSEASRLKTEGNSLFTRNDFKGAYEKYTEALKHDDKNAVLYCNRAACSLGLNRTLSSQATQLDPAYTKAWGRLANARAGLDRLDQAIEAWKGAIASLPADNLTEAQVKQRDQCMEELAKAEAKWNAQISNPRIVEGVHMPDQPEMPWERAASGIRMLVAQQMWQSSVSIHLHSQWVKAFLIDAAYKRWQRAVTDISKGEILHTSKGPSYYGRLGVSATTGMRAIGSARLTSLKAIEELTTAVLMDNRVFQNINHAFLDMYSRQIQAEGISQKAWMDSGCREVLEDIPKRLKSEGWDSVRPAVSITICGWVMRGFVEDRLKGNASTALEYYTSALEVLQWGSRVFADVDDEQRGTVFQPTFIRSVKCFRLDALMGVYLKNPSSTSEFLLAEILAGADELLEDIGRVGVPDEPNTETVPFWLAFRCYPAGQAHAARAFHYQHTGKLRQSARGLTQEVRDLYKKAASAYKETLIYYPPDELYNICAPLRELLELLYRLRDTIPIMGHIWEHFVDASQGIPLQQDLMVLTELEDALQNGRLREDDIVFRPGSVPVDT
ncbi:hypothetical protein OH76DRAFT_1519389 [Lentinus brumalis]|uniref:TPR-like protein n=1 Tax=Lentinus brumalis TaxID=2498619 RepID=A0A371DUU0_9APHY|nr:hypothetical protein OH76DRAFT_1519389 [Polyporus brumalis]